MPNIAEQYESRTVREGAAPSGQLFKWKAALPADTAYAYGSVPGLSKISDGQIDAKTLERAVEYNEKLLGRCVLSPRVVANGDAQPEGDWIPASIICQADVNWLVSRIMGGFQTDEAATARGIL